MLRLLYGNEAIALGAYHAGIKVATAYPGTPSTEILEALAQFNDIYAEWSTNEKVAMEVALGAAYSGVRTMVSMKHVGLNVAADPLFAASTTGVVGGLVIVSCDDPWMHSSQGEQDNRHFARLLKIPMLEPTDSQESYQLAGIAFQISEEFDTPVLLRSTTRLSHCKTVVDVNGERKADLKAAAFTSSPAKFVMLPTYARARRYLMEERITKLRKYVETFPLNEMLLADRKLGVISSGVAYQYAREVFKDASFLKLVTTYPIPEELVRKFSSQVERVVVVEELDPYLEDEVRRLGIKVTGKEFCPITGELNPEIVENGAIKAGILPVPKKASVEPAPRQLPPRPPLLCPGCPHVGTEYVLGKLRLRNTPGIVVAGDIGCYTLGAYAPLSAIDSTACMGASIGKALGMEKAGVGNKTVALIGDSTFVHSGITGLVDVVYNEGNITVVILDNGTTAMTGHQGHPGTGISARGTKTQAVKLEDIARGVGVKDVNVVNAFDLEAIESTIRRCLDTEGPSVVISRGACSLNVRASGVAFVVDSLNCNGCRTCLRLGCPALSVTNKKASIDTTLCVGAHCGICAQLCPKDAIMEGKK